MNSEILGLVTRRLTEHVSSASYAQLVFYVFVIFLLSSLNSKQPPRVPGAPVVGRKIWWEPSLVLQVRYFFDAFNIISSGYEKLKEVPFVLRRYDTDVTILPIKVLDEIRAIPKHRLNAKIPVVSLLIPKWTGIQFMLESYLMTHALNDRLTPHLNKYLEIAQTEGNWAWDLVMPEAKDWTQVDIQQRIRILVSRMSAKVFVGDPACRNLDWLRISLEFTEDMFVAAFTLRMFPMWSHFLVAQCIPARWRVFRHYRMARSIIGGLMEEHRERKSNGQEPQDTLLGWMMDHGSEEETQLEEMARRQCTLTLASIHTTSLGVNTVLFDLVARPEWIPVLREEVEAVAKEHGRVARDCNISAKKWAEKLEKMDSFILESLRFNPAILVGPQRVALEHITLKDGTQIPPGANVAWPAHHHSNDPSVIPDPETFDPLRNYRKRRANDGENHGLFVAGQPTKNHLTFGFGGQACPGRHFAINEMKLILSRLLLEYDFAYPEGKSRPKNIHINEMVVMDPTAKLMMKKREGSV